jgi:hypothetical protein
MQKKAKGAATHKPHGLAAQFARCFGRFFIGLLNF